MSGGGVMVDEFGYVRQRGDRDARGASLVDLWEQHAYVADRIGSANQHALHIRMGTRDEHAARRLRGGTVPRDTWAWFGGVHWYSGTVGCTAGGTKVKTVDRVNGR